MLPNRSHCPRIRDALSWQILRENRRFLWIRSRSSYILRMYPCLISLPHGSHKKCHGHPASWVGSSQWLGLMNSSWIAAHKITTLAEKTNLREIYQLCDWRSKPMVDEFRRKLQVDKTTNSRCSGDQIPLFGASTMKVPLIKSHKVWSSRRLESAHIPGHNPSNRNPFLLIKSDKPSVCFHMFPTKL